MTTIKDYTRAIKFYFEGFYMEDFVELEPCDPTSIESLMITSISLNQIEDDIDELIITTCRPGILIGKAGVRIDALRKHLQESVAKERILQIFLKEDRLWQ
jgi:ribosomal protein S3